MKTYPLAQVERGRRERREQMAKNSPFPCGWDNKPAQSVGTALGLVACGV